MKRKFALPLFLATSILLAFLLLRQVITPIVGGALFAIALAVLGGISRGFTRE